MTTTVTRRALRVYAALSSLKSSPEDDYADALVPFFEPILEMMDGQFFDPVQFANEVRRVYQWRFNKDIAEQFVPRLERKGYLKKTISNRVRAHIVTCNNNENISETEIEISEVLEKIIDHFIDFPDRLTNIFQFHRDRDELKDLLIRFLVSLDAYTEAEIAAKVERLKLNLEPTSFLDELDEGGTPLAAEEKYICARFVQHLAKTQPAFVPYLADLASIGLLTEVVDDFLKPTGMVKRTDVKIILDAPLALDLLGLSGKSAREEISIVLSALKGIGAGVIVFPVSCDEMARNLSSMLALPAAERRGPTRDAMRRGEVEEDFVRAVAANPERALEAVGVRIRRIGLDDTPSSHKWFPRERHDDFLSGITWKRDSIQAREHDADCMTLVMRLRAGQHKADPLASKYVFVTTNALFADYARRYALQSRMIEPRHCGPVLHRRDLSMIAWLRTGLDARESVPRGHLFASCERVLRVRRDVTEAVRDKLAAVNPEKLEQYQLLLEESRSVQRLMDQTLGDAKRVTATNAEELLEEMRRATAEELAEEYERKLAESRAQQAARTKAHQKEIERISAEAAEALAEKSAALSEQAERIAILEREKEAEEIRRKKRVDAIVCDVNRILKWIDIVALVSMWFITVIAVVGIFREWVMTPFFAAFAGLVSSYYSIQAFRQKPAIGLTKILDAVGYRLFRRRIMRMGLNGYSEAERVVARGGQLQRLTDAPTFPASVETD